MSADTLTTLLLAKWIAPMDGPLIRDGAVAFRAGRITDIGPAAAVRSRNPDAFFDDLEAPLLTPGLVNAHTHLELSGLTAGPPPESFADWVISLLGRLGEQKFENGEAAALGTRAGIVQCLRFGVTTVGDVTSLPSASRTLISGYSPLRAVSFGEVRAMAQRRTQFDQQLLQAVDAGWEGIDRFRIGVSPHAPYTVEPDGYRRCLETAARKKLALCTHLAETPDEATFLRDHTGALRRIWDWRGGWDDAVPTFDGGPMRFAKSVGLLDAPTLLAHVNYCDDLELDLLAGGVASVAYCPRTHEYFGHPPHRWREMLSRGVNVCLGTDSCASSPDLNLLDDARLLHSLAPEIPSFAIWEMATWRAARAIGLGQEVGTISSGKYADLIAFNASGEDPLRAVLESNVRPTACWIGGQAVSHLAVGTRPVD